MEIYNFLKFLTILALIVSGFMLQKRSIKPSGTTIYFYPFYWSIFPVLIVYTLVEGLRYGRAADYFSYRDAFIGLKFPDFEPLFAWFVNLLNITNSPFYLGFVICSFMLILSGCLLIKEIRFTGLFALPLFYLDTIAQSSNLVRMYFSMGFIFLALKYLMQNKNNRVIIFLGFAFLTHYSSLVLFPFIYLFNKNQNPFKSRYVIVVLFIISNLFPPSLEFIAENISKFAGTGLYEHYLENTSKWILAQDLETIDNSFSIYYYIRSYLTPLCVIWFGQEYIKKYKRYKYGVFYNLYVVGVLLMPSALTLPTELFYRLCLYFVTFKFIVLSIIFYEFFNKKSKYNFLSRAFILILLFDSIYLLSKTIFNYSIELGNHFIWDKTFY